MYKYVQKTQCYLQFKWLFFIVIGLCLWFTANSAFARIVGPGLGESVIEISTKEAGKGKFLLSISDSTHSEFQTIADFLKKDGRFNKVVQNLNENLIIPVDVTIIFKEDTDNYGPYYNPMNNTITITYDFMRKIEDIHRKHYSNETNQERLDFVLNVTKFTLYHELGHALSNIFQLPVLGAEEDAADNLAVLIALEFAENGYEIVLDTADLFDMQSTEDQEIDQDEFWDEHSLDAQRFYSIICITYGKYPAKLRAEVEKRKDTQLLKFIDTKGDRCAAEYHNQLYSWLKLMKPYLNR